MTLDNVIRLRVTEDEKTVIKEVAEKYRVSMSEMIRRQIFDDLERLKSVEKYDKEDVERLLLSFANLTNEIGKLEQQLLKVGINMNQIAKKYNQNHGLDLVKLDNCLEEFEEITEHLKSLSDKSWNRIFDE